ncbi:MAG TPA: class I SAM-dependent methyltransferase [Gemmatimonadaceae bacterium]
MTRSREDAPPRGKEYVERAQRKWMRTFHGLPEVSLESLIRQPTTPADPILDECCLPPYLGPSGHNDFAPLMQIVCAMKPEWVVELGTAFGNTVANICNQSPLTRVVTVNALPENQSGSCVTCELSRDEIGRVYRSHGYAHRVTQIYENTLDLDLGSSFSEPVVDLAIIDACHDREYVLNDFDKVRDHVAPSGVVLFHDTHPEMDKSLEGSYLACMELRRRGYDVRHLARTWWGIWRRDWSRPIA